MEANELRVGNWVSVNNFHTVQVWAIKPPEIVVRGAASFHAEMKEVQGIPLTEEWLKRADFNFKGFLRKEFIRNGKIITFYLCDVSGYGFETSQGIKRIHFVHQLQNLFFALEQEELKFRF